MHTRLALSLLAMTGLLAGCQEVSLVDNIDVKLNWSPLVGRSDALHSPYVAGARFDVYVETRQRESLVGWRLESSDANVLVTGQPVLSADRDTLYVPCEARGAGESELRVRDGSGALRHARTVEVRIPDQIDVLAHGPLLIDHPEEAPVDSPRVLAGGTATFLVEYRARGELLSGNGALETKTTGDTQASVRQSFLFEQRDWLVIDARGPGVTGQVELGVVGATVRSLPVEVVAESAIARVELRGQTESSAQHGELVTVLAQAYAADGVPIWGVDYAFAANGVSQVGEGDLYRYRLDDKLPVMLEASHGTLSNGVLIHSGGGIVDSTNRIGCSMSPRASSGNALGMCLVAAMAWLARRRGTRAACPG